MPQLHGSLDWEFPPSSAAPFVRTSNPPCHSMPPKQMHVRHKNVNMLYSLDMSWPCLYSYIELYSDTCIYVWTHGYKDWYVSIYIYIYILWYYIHVYVYVWFAVGDSSWKRSPASIANLWGSWSRWTPWRRTWTWNSPLEKTRTCRWLEGRIWMETYGRPPKFIGLPD